MGHYSDLDDAKAYNEKLERKYACLKPKTTNKIDDALGFCMGGKPAAGFSDTYLNNEMVSSKERCDAFNTAWEDHTAKKDVTHKAAGARYCYLSSLASASHYAGCAEDEIGKYLDKLLDHDFRGKASTQHIFNMIITYCGIALGDDKELWDGVIAVRMHGLGSGKYSVNNHKLPMQKHLLLDAAARHLIAYLYVSNIDDDSGESHLCHIVANILMFAAQLNIEKGE